MMNNLLKPSLYTTKLIRNYGVNSYRKKKGLPPRFAYSPLSETPEFSYLDGKGYAPLNHRQQARYERDQNFGAQVVKYMEQFKLAKKLVEQSKINAKNFKTSGTANQNDDLNSNSNDIPKDNLNKNLKDDLNNN